MLLKMVRRRGEKLMLGQLRGARRVLITTMGWNFENTTKTQVFENVRAAGANNCRVPAEGLITTLG